MERREFQSTPPCGGDRKEYKKEKIFIISIHAPLRGRLVPGCAGAFRRRFQSTPPCGGDRSPGFSRAPSADFNPRPLAGATHREHQTKYDSQISIHAPLRGRLIFMLPKISSRGFQSTPPCGGDLQFVIGRCSNPYFNPRPLAGATDVI